MRSAIGGADLVRIVTGRSGRVRFTTELVMRFNYGATVPWVSRLDDGRIGAIDGPERVVLQTPGRRALVAGTRSPLAARVRDLVAGVGR